MDFAKVVSLSSKKNAVNPSQTQLAEVKPPNGFTKTLEAPEMKGVSYVPSPTELIDTELQSNGGTSIVVTSFIEERDDVTDNANGSVSPDDNTLNIGTSDKETLWKSKRPTSAARWKLVKNAVVAQSAFQHKEKRKRPNRRMQGTKQAIPVLPLPLAVCLLVCNCCVPGLGTILSGFTYCCIGVTYKRTERNSMSVDKIPGLICTNVGIGIAQLFTTTFLLVGWFWSISWGVTMVYLAIEHEELMNEN